MNKFTLYTFNKYMLNLYVYDKIEWVNTDRENYQDITVAPLHRAYFAVVAKAVNWIV